jgi:isopenicillin-N N-acyltransferase like protein
VTGMNAERVSIGEMGGRGLGHWEGVPMAFLVRLVLEEADSLSRGIAIVHDNPRTCEYYFVIADGETGKAVGLEACWNAFGVIGMGESHPRLPDAIKDAVVLSAGDRYKELVKRVHKGLGQFDPESARHLMDRPVAMKSNLHSVLFETTTTRLWVANASKDGKPAAEQPYQAFQLCDLLTHQADPSSTLLPAPPAAPAHAAQADR